MTLPLTRDETAAANGMVSSSLLNDLQDCHIGGKHGALVLNVGPGSAIVDDIVMMAPTSVAIVRAAAAAAANAWFDIDLPVGAVITQVKVICTCTAATLNAVTATWKKTLTVVGGAIGTAAASVVVAAVGSAATANTLLAITLTPGAPVTIAANEKHGILCVFSNSAGDKGVYRIEVSYYKP